MGICLFNKMKAYRPNNVTIWNFLKSHKNRTKFVMQFTINFKLFLLLGVIFTCYSKGQSNGFSTSSFLHHSNQPWLLTNGLKYFWFWLRIRWVIRILSPKIGPPGVSYPGESDSPWYHTPISQSPQGIIPRQVNLPEVSYPCESISLGYHTPASQ